MHKIGTVTSQWASLRAVLATLALILAILPAEGHSTKRIKPSGSSDSVTLATQSLLPLFMKSDWTASSFSPDGHYLLVVDETRSFILDTAEGRELRGIQLPRGEIALWSRPLPTSGMEYRWLVATNGGLLLVVDGRNGRAKLLRSFPPSAANIKYRRDEFSFEIASRSVVIVNLNRTIERKKGNSTETIDDRRLFVQSLKGTEQKVSAPVPRTLFFSNLTSMLSVNAQSQYVALASLEGRRVVLWHLDGPSTRPNSISLSCVYDGEEKMRAIAPVGRGFIVVNTAGKAFLLDPREQSPRNCTDRSPADPSHVKCSFDASIAAIAGRGRKATELIFVANDYTVVQMNIFPNDCTYTKTVLTNVKQAFFAAPIYKPSDVQATKDVPEWNGFVAAPAFESIALVAGPSLLRLEGTGAAPALIQSLAGRPTGAVEVEAGTGFILASRTMAPLRAFDVSAGRLRTYEYDYRKYFDDTFFYNKPFSIASKLGAVAILERDGRLQFHEGHSSVDTAELPRPQLLDVKEPNALCSSDDGHRLWVLSAGDTVSFYELDPKGNFSKVASFGLGAERDVFKIACDGAGNSAIAADSLTDAVFVFEASGNAVRIVQRFDVPHSSDLMVRPSLSSDSRLLAVGPYLYVRPTDSSLFKRHGSVDGANRLVFNQQADRLLAIGQRSKLYEVRRNPNTVSLSPMAAEIGAAEDGAFVGRFLVVVRGIEHLQVLSPGGQEIGRLVFGDDAQWLFTDGQGRFDTYDAEGRASAYWVMKDDPMRALDPELFMRDYLEPRLLPRLMDCKLKEMRNPKSCAEVFAPIRSVDALNRARPEIEFLGVTPDPGTDNTVTLQLRVSGAQEAARTESSRPRKSSGGFDLHVRLNGQLVARRPIVSGMAASTGKEDSTWRGRSRILSGTERVEISIPGIKLPHRERAGEVEFSAYAFNEDRVKGVTRVHKYPIQASASIVRRAFVVAIGSSAYEDKTLDLRYPAEDARKLIDTVAPALRSTKRFSEVIPIMLTSEWDLSAGERQIVKADSTKERIRQVLEAISGSIRYQGVVPSSSTPDDTVIIIFSGHGLSHAQDFYLVPYDSGSKSSARSNNPNLDLEKQISSTELAYWLRDLVADEIVMIIDACHSSASVETAEFKPGPMGARGFGQLAYDKGMRVLAATRPNDLAWESNDKGQGLLSYALLQEGLAQRKADHLPSDGIITIGEWLQYAVDRVPALYGETSRSLKPGDARIVTFDTGSRSSREVSVNGKRVQAKSQQPSIFDFRRGQDAPLSVAPLPRN